MTSAPTVPRETPAEYGRRLARQAPPLNDDQIEAAARIFAAAAAPQAQSA